MKSSARPGRGGYARYRHASESVRREGGFTLIELLIAMVILPFIVGALSLAIIAVLSLQGSTTNRVSDAADAQVVSTNFENDVHSAVMITTSSSVAGECGPAAQVNVLKPILSVEWSLNQSNGYQSVVTYVLNTQSAGTQLMRYFSANGPSSTLFNSSTVAYNVSSSTMPVVNQNPSTACVAGAYAPATEWIPTSCVTTVSLAITEPEKVSANTYSYSLVSSPEASSSSSSSTQLNAPGTGCGFADPGTGTYAASLCFVDFGNLVPSQLVSTSAAPASPTNCPQGGEYITSPISDTEYTLSFCLRLQSPTATYSNANSDSGSCTATPPVAAICAATVPTYADPPTSEAFLGDNSFYMNIPGNPALYETQEGGGGSSVPIYLQLYNIQVADVGGNPASGWELVTGDAESTDSGESLTWSTCSSVTANCAATPNTSPALGLLPNTYNGNTATAAIGNSCSYSPAPTGTEFPGTYLTGIGTPTVESASTNSNDKSGTVMLEALTPGTLSVEMVGTGLEAIFVGVLLP